MTAWQLDMLNHSLKKQQKLRLLAAMLGTCPSNASRCLLVTNGDNNGALNHRFRELGGDWRWAELDAANIAAMEAFLGEPVHHASADRLPFEAASFDRVVVIDVHEHLHEIDVFNTEIARVLAPGGIAIVTTPNGDPRLPVAVLKRWIGMDVAAYGHVVQGYRTEELEAMLRNAGLETSAQGAYARFFTELVELAINFGYVRLLAGRRSRTNGAEIAPRNAAQLEAVGRSYRIYRALYPLLRAVASLDRLVPGRGGYAVAVMARKP